MFTYVALQNFKSFGNIRFDFKKTQNKTKKFIAIYGENGSGKSNFVSAFEFMHYSFNSLPIGQIANQVKIDDYRMIGCSDPATVEFGFELNGVEGYYKIIFKDVVLSEELYYLCGKKRGVMFSLTMDEKKISPTLFSNGYAKDFENELEKYWGKHTFFAILLRETEEKNLKYIEKNVSQALIDVFNTLKKTFVSNDKYSAAHPLSGSSVESYTCSGTIPLKNENYLNKNEKILNELLGQLYSDIKCVYYEKQIKDNTIIYSLHAKKVIAGEIRDIPFDYESTGTKRLLKILSAAVAVMNGETVIYDEIDSGIHDILMNTIITSLAEAAEGQLIITTHNTFLLESIDPQSAYVIYVDCEGNKEARCIADYGERVQKTNNMRNLYLKGIYGGIPYTSEIDFSYFMSNFESGGDESDE